MTETENMTEWDVVCAIPLTPALGVDPYVLAAELEAAVGSGDAGTLLAAGRVEVRELAWLVSDRAAAERHAWRVAAVLQRAGVAWAEHMGPTQVGLALVDPAGRRWPLQPQRVLRAHLLSLRDGWRRT